MINWSWWNNTNHDNNDYVDIDDDQLIIDNIDGYHDNDLHWLM